MTVVSAGNTVEVDYIIRNDDGELIHQSESEPWVFTLGQSQMVRGVEKAILGYKVGDTIDIKVAAEDGYGLRDAALTSYADFNQFDDVENLVVGMTLTTEVDGEMVVATVKEVKDNKVLLDMNHPFAGKTLHFNIKILSIR